MASSILEKYELIRPRANGKKFPCGICYRPCYTNDMRVNSEAKAVCIICYRLDLIKEKDLKSLSPNADK